MKIYVRTSNDIEDYKDCVIEKLDHGYSVYDSSGEELTSGLDSIYEARDYINRLNEKILVEDKYLYENVDALKELYKSFTEEEKKSFDKSMIYHLYEDFLRYCSISLDDDNVVKQKLLFKKQPISTKAIRDAYKRFLKSTEYSAFKLYQLYVNTETTDTDIKYTIYFQNRYKQP